MVFQSYAIFPHLSVGQNVGFGLELKGRPKNEIKEEVAKILKLGVTGYVVKPYEPAVLLAAVQAALAKVGETED